MERKLAGSDLVGSGGKWIGDLLEGGLVSDHWNERKIRKVDWGLVAHVLVFDLLGI